MAKSAYNQQFFQSLSNASRQSADIVVPIVVSYLPPIRTILDIGCGTGAWLKVFQEHTHASITGVDGPWVDKNQLQIKPEEFVASDLTNFKGDEKTYDLAICLEVAEHLPEKKAESLIAMLTSKSDVVLFSAAIPEQGGTRHINEQWPEYWAALFEKFGFVPADAVRPFIWNNQAVSFWFAQNILFFIRQTSLKNYPDLALWVDKTQKDYLTRIHPQHYLKNLNPLFRWKNKIKNMIQK
jgi:SAM-dependent methyltransferase